VAGASLVGGLSVARNAHAAYADDTIRVALIGCGSRGRGAASQCLDVSDSIKLVALADVFEARVQDARKIVSDKHGDKVDVPDERMFVGLDAYERAIDSDVDLVLIATPPGVRPAQYEAAVKAGKNIFMEKPLCTDAAGFRSLMKSNELAEKRGLKVVIGLQRHHQPNYQETVKRIQDGMIGEIMFLRCYWNMGNIWAKKREPGDTELAYQLRNWQYFHYFGGDHITEQHIHNLDVCNWVMDGHPAEANGMGGRQGRDRFPDMGMIYDHHFVEYTFDGGVKMFSQCRQMPNCFNQVAEFAHGTKGVAKCEGAIDVGGKTVWKYEGPNVNGWAQEHVDLIRAIRNDEKCHEGWYGATSSMTSVLGRLATYSGKVVNWDEVAEKGKAEAPELRSWDQQMPIMPDPDGTYKTSVAMPGVWKLPV
jgi:predicted dehydrogenase